MNIGVSADRFQSSLKPQDVVQTTSGTRELAVGCIVISRTWLDDECIGHIERKPYAEAFEVSVQLQQQDNVQVWRGEQLVSCGVRQQASLSILNLTEHWSIHHLAGADTLTLRIPFARLRAFAAEAGHPLFMGIGCGEGQHDPVMFALASALLPALDNPQQANLLFVERICLAVLAHLSQTYGGVHLPVDQKGTLAPWQERRVRAFLEAHFHEPVAVADLAEMCDLSRSYFIKAFKESFGRTPYRWLSEYRVAHARNLLLGDLSLAEIAIACGFSDQSHMTRSFTDLVGIAPGQFRRQSRDSSKD